MPNKHDIARFLIIVAAAAASLVALSWCLGLAATVSLPNAQHFRLTKALYRAAADTGMPGIVLGSAYALLSSAGLLSGLLAIALQWRRTGERYATDLAAALALGSLCLAWFYFLRVFDEFGIAARLASPWVIALDAAMAMGIGLALAWFIGFLVRFPVAIAGNRLLIESYPESAGLSRPRAWLFAALRWTENSVLIHQERSARWARRLGLSRIADWYARMAALTKVRLGRELSLTEQAHVAEFVETQRRWLAVNGTLPILLGTLALAAGLAWRCGAAEFARNVLGAGTLSISAMGLVLGTYAMLDNYRRGLPEHRRQIEWILWGLLLGWAAWTLPFLVLILVLPFVDLGWLPALRPGTTAAWTGASVHIGSAFMLNSVILAIALSVFYRGAIDPGLALKRTTIYSVFALLLTALFVALEGAASASVVTGLGLPSQSGALLAGTAAALFFGPLRRRVEKGVERLVDRLRPADLLPEGKRYPATVMFCDLSGYTALAARDEDAALTLAALFHKEARRAAELGGGRLVKTIGDATLTLHTDSATALAALTRLHQRFRAGTELLELPALAIHAGIHSGEVVEAPDGDVFGATVNLAARLQGQAGGGQALLGGATAEAARASGYALHAVGARHLKGYDQPVDCVLWELTS